MFDQQSEESLDLNALISSGFRCLLLLVLGFGFYTIQGPLLKMTKTTEVRGRKLASVTAPVTVLPMQNINKPTSGSTTHALSTKHATTEVRHIGFLKVHKAASSTMQNIFFRFGLKRNLTFVFTEHPNYFSRSAYSHLPLIPPKFRTGYDVICNHGVFSHDIYSSLLPNDTVYLAIVRDPLPLFISSVNYYTQDSQALRYLTRIPGNKLKNLIQNDNIYDHEAFSYTRNTMARDFGFKPGLDEIHIKEKLAELGDTFTLVLLVEYFEESLVLMKRYLGWQLKEILFISNNVLGTGANMANLSPSDLLKFKKRNHLDYHVYEYFYEKFWRQFSAEPNDIHDEILHLKNVLKLVYTFCNGEKSPGEDSSENPLTIDASQWTQTFSLTPEDCGYLQMDEQRFITILRHAQGSELPPPRKRPDIRRPRVIRKRIDPAVMPYMHELQQFQHNVT